MRLPRFTTRRLMVLVAAVAIVFKFSVDLENRRSEFTDRCLFHWQQTDNAQPQPPLTLEGAGRRDLLKQFHLAMAQKYRRAARYPWLPVPPDPPPPE